MDMANSILINSGVPENLWGEALMTACHILNRLPFKNSDKTPYTIQKNRNLNLDHLKVQGCLTKIKSPENRRKKIYPKTVDGIFIRYASDSNANRFLIINSEISDIANNTIVKSRDVRYFENIFPCKTRLNTNVNEDNVAPSFSQSKPLEEETQAESRKSERTRIEKVHEDFYALLVEDSPTTFEDAMKSSDSPF